jgi:hypothetical protein
MTFSKASGRLTGNPIVDLYNRIEIECGKAESKLGKHLIFAVIIGIAGLVAVMPKDTTVGIAFIGIASLYAYKVNQASEFYSEWRKRLEKMECNDMKDLIVLFYDDYESRSSFKDIASIPSYSQALPILESKTKS